MAVEDFAADASFWAVVPAGGSGTRLWPLSRAGRPKFLLDLTGSGRSLLQSTVDRLRPLAGEQIVVVTGAAHAEAVCDQLPDLPRDQILAEPTPRDSMPAIAWAAAVLEARDEDAVLGSFAADHVIPDGEGFRETVRQAVAVARTGKVVTIGLTPTHAATGFGYIHEGAALAVDGAPDARAVVEFVEKPDADTAQRYLEAGSYRWNAGMFVVQARVLLDILARTEPDLVAGVRLIAGAPQDQRAEVLADVWPTLTKISIDHAVAEPAAAVGDVAMVAGGFGWDDVGDFAFLGELRGAAGRTDGVATLGAAQIIARDSTGFVASDRLVALIGVEDIVVIDTPDALLVTTKARSQDVKAIVDELAARGSDLR